MTGQGRDRSSDLSPVRVRALVAGSVQGVGFRAFVCQRVRLQGLRVTGWVRNRDDGRVELLAEGPRWDVEQLLAAVAEGPPGAAVDRVERRDEAAAGDCTRFTIAS